jgi:hypothetical protein
MTEIEWGAGHSTCGYKPHRIKHLRPMSESNVRRERKRPRSSDMRGPLEYRLINAALLQFNLAYGHTLAVESSSNVDLDVIVLFHVGNELFCFFVACCVELDDFLVVR